MIWADKGIGMIEPSGSLDDHALPDLRAALASAREKAGRPCVAVIEDKVTGVSQIAISVLVSECERLREQGGDLVLISTDGMITRSGRPSGETLFMRVYNTIEGAIGRFAAAPTP
jgi:anti-anti-sigma factor